jgi:hypothetical protein
MMARASSSSFFTTSPKDGEEEDPFWLSLTYAARPVRPDAGPEETDAET